MKFKHLFFAAALFSIAPLFCACNDDDNESEVPRDPEEDPSSQPDTTPEVTSPTEATGLYVINAGNLSNNVNGTLSFINFEKGTYFVATRHNYFKNFKFPKESTVIDVWRFLEFNEEDKINHIKVGGKKS